MSCVDSLLNSPECLFFLNCGQLRFLQCIGLNKRPVRTSSVADLITAAYFGSHFVYVMIAKMNVCIYGSNRT